MDKDSKQVVVLLTHPNIKESRANKALMDAISDMGEVAIYNLYEMRMEDAFNAEIWSTIISHASASCISVSVLLDVGSFFIEEMVG